MKDNLLEDKSYAEIMEQCKPCEGTILAFWHEDIWEIVEVVDENNYQKIAQTNTKQRAEEIMLLFANEGVIESIMEKQMTSEEYVKDVVQKYNLLKSVDMV
jgi:hypothetical protein